MSSYSRAYGPFSRRRVSCCHFLDGEGQRNKLGDVLSMLDAIEHIRGEVMFDDFGRWSSDIASRNLEEAGAWYHLIMREE